MTALLEADPGEVRRAASVLDAAAEEAARLGQQLDRQRPACWRSPSSRDYVGQLTSLSQRVGRIGRSHDEAAEVLAGYARALDEAQERARYARQLHEEGSRRSAEWAARQVVGPDPGWSLSNAAQRTLSEAEELERAAAARAASRLRQLAAAAPAQGWTSKVLRPLEDVGMTAVAEWRAAPGDVAALAGAAWSALPWVHGGREQREGREALLDAAKVWEAWLEAGRDALNGRPGLGLGALVPGVPGAPKRIKNGGDGGFLDGIEEGLLTVNDVGDAWEQAHQARALQDRIVSLRQVPLPGVEALLAGQVDLAHHEARGGHAILKHVGKRIEVLQARLDLERKGDPTAFRSTFPDLQTAEELVRQTLIADPSKIHDLLRTPGKGPTIEMVLPLAEPVGTVLHQDGRISSGREVVVILKKRQGEVFVKTAWLNP